jgi:lipoprotein-releasing system ATP-binding protein
MVPIVKLENVEKTYYGVVNKQVLFDINLVIEEKSISALVGQSGSGKSTLLNIIGTLDRPSGGNVYIDGQRTTNLKKWQLAGLRNRIIGFVFQFHYLLPEFTALENVLMPYLIDRKTSSREVTKWADELFEILGISAIKNNPASQMSGGQQQRTAIARALINHPKLILADEPTGNLDSDNSSTIYRIFREINEQYKTSFLVVTHDRRIADGTDRIIEIHDGKITLDVYK